MAEIGSDPARHNITSMPKEVKFLRNTLTDLPALFFERQKDWAVWLTKNHATSSGVSLKLAQKASGLQAVSYDEALEVALCYDMAVPMEMLLPLMAARLEKPANPSGAGMALRNDLVKD